MSAAQEQRSWNAAKRSPATYAGDLDTFIDTVRERRVTLHIYRRVTLPEASDFTLLRECLDYTHPQSPNDFDAAKHSPATYAGVLDTFIDTVRESVFIFVY